jgi:hypothetical protein
MSLDSYSSAHYSPDNFPVDCNPWMGGTSTIYIPDSYIINSCDVTIDITPTPSDGATVLQVDLIQSANWIDVNLHNRTAEALQPNINFPNDRLPYAGSMSDFNGYDTFSAWYLNVYNDSFSESAYINSWTLNFDVTIPPPPPSPEHSPFFPSAPNGRNLPTAIVAGLPINIKENYKLLFKLIGTSGIMSNKNTIKTIPIDSKLINCVVSARNTGSSTSTTISLNKISNGVITTIFNQTLTLSSGNSYFYLKNFNPLVNSLNRGDILFANINSRDSNITDLIIEVVLNGN